MGVHAGSAGQHGAKSSLELLDANRIKKAPYPSQPPELASTGLFLFGEVKKRFLRSSFHNPEELLSAIERILNTI